MENLQQANAHYAHQLVLYALVLIITNVPNAQLVISSINLLHHVQQHVLLDSGLKVILKIHVFCVIHLVLPVIKLRQAIIFALRARHPHIFKELNVYQLLHVMQVHMVTTLF